MHENVFEKYPNANISGSIVWMPILEKDTFDAAVPSSMALSDARIKHFYDNNRSVGKTIADSVGWQGHVAWDIYLFYAPTTNWTQTPPKPEYWMHQLSDAWAKNDQYRTGGDLKNELFVSIKKLTMDHSPAAG